MWRMCDVSKRWNRHLPAVAHEAAASSLRCAVSAFAQQAEDCSSMQAKHRHAGAARREARFVPDGSWLAAANFQGREWVAKRLFDKRSGLGEGDRRKARGADRRGDGGDSGSLRHFRRQMDCFSRAMCDCPSPLHSCGAHRRQHGYVGATPLNGASGEPKLLASISQSALTASRVDPR